MISVFYSHFLKLTMSATHLIDPDGQTIPIESIPALTVLCNEMVNEVAARTLETQEIIRVHKELLFKQFWDFLELCFQENNVPLLKEGQRTIRLTNFAETAKVEYEAKKKLALNDNYFSSAKALLLECVKDWTAQNNAEVKSIVQKIITPDARGRISLYQIIYLANIKSQDERFIRAQNLIKKSLTTQKIQPYLRVYQKNERGRWEQIVLNFSAL